jgi:hypothetical protein
VGNHSKIEAHEHYFYYDFMEKVFVRKVVDRTANGFWEKYCHGTINLFEDWTHLTIQQSKEWQSDVKHQGSDENCRSSAAWILAFLCNSFTQEF